MSDRASPTPDSDAPAASCASVPRHDYERAFYGDGDVLTQRLSMS